MQSLINPTLGSFYAVVFEAPEGPLVAFVGQCVEITPDGARLRDVRTDQLVRLHGVSCVEVDGPWLSPLEVADGWLASSVPQVASHVDALEQAIVRVNARHPHVQ